MVVRWITGFLDTPSGSAAESERFWRAVTSSGLSERRGDGRFATLLPAGGDAYLRVQVVDDLPARSHLDLHVEDVEALGVRAEGLGARRVFAEDGLVVLRSPAGLPFCAVRWAGERVRPAAAGLSLVDQLCLDLPEAVFESEVSFWSALTGWARDSSDLAEFGRLRVPVELPLRLLFQRVGSAEAGVHVDFACDDVGGEVERHRALGATIVRRTAQWVTLRDPVGREYCLTGRRVSVGGS